MEESHVTHYLFIEFSHSCSIKSAFHISRAAELVTNKQLKCRKILTPCLNFHMSSYLCLIANPSYIGRPITKLYFLRTKLLQAVSSRRLVIFPWLAGVCWRVQSVCSIHTLLFKCHYTDRTAHVLSPCSISKLPFLAGLFDQIGAKNVLSSLFNFDPEVSWEVSQVNLVFRLQTSWELKS